ncbi:toxin [Phragmitibacter flavus]|uniref:Toxin n=1 Tax=Phragmitibacter flavus TaxID=2576071 RepID=A0A5R8KC26_9BACT|nr:toxin [Phragmitibacter flavus]
MRVVVVGCSCAGKSTFGDRLADILKCPRMELDALYWGPDWTPRLPEIFQDTMRKGASGERWVADGNYKLVREVLWQRATMIVWLNYRFPRVFSQGLRRTVARVFLRKELWNGNRESFRGSFMSKDSILVWMVTTFSKRRRELAVLRSSGQFDNVKWLEFTHPRQAEKWLKSLKQNEVVD